MPRLEWTSRPKTSTGRRSGGAGSFEFTLREKAVKIDCLTEQNVPMEQIALYTSDWSRRDQMKGCCLSPICMSWRTEEVHQQEGEVIMLQAMLHNLYTQKEQHVKEFRGWGTSMLQRTYVLWAGTSSERPEALKRYSGKPTVIEVESLSTDTLVSTRKSEGIRNLNRTVCRCRPNIE